MTRLRLLDLFCCAGGASVGYARAGFEVVGVDIRPRRNYPFRFVQMDALDYVRIHGWRYDAIHASPPCQAFTIANKGPRERGEVEHPDLLAPTRDALRRLGRPYVIENVPGAPLIDPMLLCGSMFDLRARDVDGRWLALRRHRLFESNVWLMSAGGCAHDATPVGGSYGGGHYERTDQRDAKRRGGYTPPPAVRAALLGIDWKMTRHELAQAIPPAYTEHIGTQLIAEIRRAAA